MEFKWLFSRWYFYVLGLFLVLLNSDTMPTIRSPEELLGWTLASFLFSGLIINLVVFIDKSIQNYKKKWNIIDYKRKSKSLDIKELPI